MRAKNRKKIQPLGNFSRRTWKKIAILQGLVE